MNEYFDKHGGCAPFGENEVLYSAYFHQLKEVIHPGFIDFVTIHRLIESQKQYDSSGNFVKYQAYSTTDTFSHDNLTGVLSLRKLLKLNTPWNEIFPRDFWRRIHPRDLVTWIGLKIPLIHWVLGWIPALAHIVACINEFESDGVTLATSGKLRAWLYINSHNVPLTKWICNAIIGRRGGWYQVFLYYFKDENHPCVVLSKELR